jgi:hypothetical protein
MKNQLTIILMTLSTLVMGQQVKVFQEQSLSRKNIQTIGIQTDRFYVSMGSNMVEQIFGLHKHFVIRTQVEHYAGQTYWYQSPTNHYGVQRPKETMWTASDWGNDLIDQTNYKGAVISDWVDSTQTYFTINTGIVKNLNNTKLRIGAGINISNTKGKHTNTKITTDRNVNYYWDNVLDQYHVVVMSNRVTTQEKIKSLDKISMIPTINISLIFSEYFSIGYNTSEGATIGMIYNFK